MAVDSFMMFLDYNGVWLEAESKVDFGSDNPQNQLAKEFITNAGKVFEVDSFGFGIEQTVTIGSQSGGAGAGKVQFNEFTIDRKIDVSSPNLFQMACSGKSFKRVSLGFRKAAGTQSSGEFFLRFDFKLVAVKTISWSHDDESPKESMAFMYGGLWMRYYPQDANGGMDMKKLQEKGWNRVKNVADTQLGTDIT